MVSDLNMFYGKMASFFFFHCLAKFSHKTEKPDFESH